jgi:hypothetical protein
MAITRGDKIMKKHIRCIACGRQRKVSHEKRCGTDKAYSKGCLTYEDFKKSEHYAGMMISKKSMKGDNYLVIPPDLPVEFVKEEVK